MKRNDYLYPSGEFARLTGVNKRTLHYYNDIGLFARKSSEKTATIIIPAFSLHSWS